MPESEDGEYREFAPHPSLAEYVECFWTKRGRHSEEPASKRVVPDGSADIIVDGRGADAAVIGTMLRPIVVPNSPSMDLVAVRFRPGGAWPFFGLHMSEITDCRIDLTATGSGSLDGLAERVAETPATEARVVLFERALRQRLGALPEPDPLVAAAVARLERCGGCLAVGELAQELGVGTRLLNRRFEQHVGISPKQLARILRIRHAVGLLHRVRGIARTADTRPRPDWLGVALQAGFYDQAHFIRDFRAITGVTPTVWLEA